MNQPADVLTPQELRIFRLWLEESSCKEMANRLGISVETVKLHRKHILKKLGITSRREWRIFLRHYPDPSLPDA